MRRDEKRTAYSEEASGALVALFSVAVILVALFSCVLVAYLTVDVPSLPNVESGSTAKPADPSAPVMDSTPLFTPSQDVILPKSTASTKTADVASGYAVLVDAASGEILAANIDALDKPIEAEQGRKRIFLRGRIFHREKPLALALAERKRGYERINVAGYLARAHKSQQTNAIFRAHFLTSISYTNIIQHFKEFFNMYERKKDTFWCPFWCEKRDLRTLA